MIAEDVLERGLAAAADEYDVPEGGVDRVRGLLGATMQDLPTEPVSPTRPRGRLRHPSSGTGWLAGVAAAVVLLIALPLTLGGMSSDEDGGDTALSRADAPAAAPGPQERSGGGSDKFAAPLGVGSADVDFGVRTGRNDFDPLPTAPNRVVKTGVLDLQVPTGQVSATLDDVADIAIALRGYVESSRTSEGTISPSGRVTMRVPVNAFEDAVARARALGKVPGAKVLGLQTSGEDVTGKYVDLQARIHALQRTRETFLDLLAKAETIGETLSVQQRVTDVQTQIEQLQGQLKVLSSQSSMSTLTVTVDQKLVATTARGEKSGIHKAFDRSVDRFVNGVEAIVAGTGPVLLAILVIAALWFGGRFGYRVLRRNMV
jgi:hypothetical protein